MDGLSVVTLTALSTVMGWRRASDVRRRKAFSGFFLKYTSIKLIQNIMPFYTVLAIFINFLPSEFAKRCALMLYLF
jgi:hypothetical protein